MKKIFYAGAFLLICCNLHAYCQNDNSVISNAVAGLKTLSGNHSIEKAYLHFDKPYYAVGDTMRFKAYVMMGEHYDLSKLSGVLHVDLIAPDNTIAKTIKLQLVNGIGWGDFALPFALNAGNYRVRAYTNYMKNDPAYFFDKTIAIGSAMNTAAAAPAPADKNEKADLQFFPEGGALISAMISKVAFKAIGANGLAIDVKGTITDNTNAPVASFASTHLGMGTFILQPEEGKTYKARVTFSDGSQAAFDLPKAESKGIALSVNDTLGKLSVEIRCNKAYFQENLNKSIGLVIYGGGVVNTVNTKLDSRRLSLDIPNNQFFSGVVQVTLFSQTGDPLSERLVFLKNPDMVDLGLTSKKSTYGPRERTSFMVSAKNKGNDVEGHFSVSVIDESKVPVDENNEETILTYLLLNSALRGYVEQANYYFKDNSQKTAADLDALMLTQGYRRFSWKRLQSARDSDFSYLPEKTLEISGSAKTAAGLPIRDMDVMLMTTNRAGMLGERTDDKGKFTFSNLPPMADGTVLSLQATGSTKTKNTTVFTVDDDKPGPAVAGKQVPGLQTDVNKNMTTYLAYSEAVPNTAIALNSTSKYNTKNALNAHNAVFNEKNNYESSNLGGSGHADQVINGDQLVNAVSLSVGLGGLLHGVNFVNGVPYNHVSTSMLNGIQVTEPMYIVLDGSPLDLGQSIDNISPLSIATVEMLTGANATIYGMNGGSGVLVITSRRSAPAVTSSGVALGTLSFKAAGFYVAREFYSPKYENKEAANKPDLRSTICWIPELVTNKDGFANFEYYNADGKGSYRVVIEGIDNNGNIGRQVYRYTVQ